VVWIGFDDNRDLQMEGARSALPIWAAFMKRAHQLNAYRNPGSFRVPGGLVNTEIDPETGRLATSHCPMQATEFFLDGTEPTETCRDHEEAVASTPH
jgi:penicillin-binding protein 1B